MESIYPETIIDCVDALVYVVNYDTNEVVYGNRMVRDRFPEYHQGVRCYTLFHGYTCPCADCPLAQIRSGERIAGAPIWVDKLNRWFQMEYIALETETGERICVSTGVDITLMKDAAHTTERVLDSIHAAAYTIGIRDFRIRSFNQGLKDMLPAIKKGDLCYQTLWDLKAPCPHCPIPSLSEQVPFNNIEIYNEKLKRHLSIDSARVMSSEGEPVVVFTGYDISRRVQSEERLRVVAYYDMQLGIKNRVALMEDMTEMFRGGEACCLCVLCIKNFSNYNLLYGRQAGDQLLRRLAGYCTEHYNAKQVYRSSGAKLAFLSAGAEERERMESVLRRAFTEVMGEGGQSFRLYVDMAFVAFPRFAASPEEAVGNAEYMLQKTKKRESCEVLRFERQEQEALMRRNKIASIVRSGLTDGKFRVYYQPIYEISTGQYTKCEALLRLYDEEMGWISPVEFVPIAEESGLISDIGKFVLQESCRLLADRAREGFRPIQVNVNVSTVQFARSTFYFDVLSTVERSGADPKLLQLEVTESILINSFDYIVDIMKRLIERGISFAVDDFGTGYSSLSYIGTLPVECIKLDKSFVDRIVESEVYVLIVENVIKIAKGLNFNIVAEGIECRNQYEILRRLGCDYIQGYLFAKPLPREEFEAFLFRERERSEMESDGR